MKSVALISLLFACFSVKAITTTIPAKPDTAMPKSILHKEAMLKEFGDNDTCRALIEYWYSKRSTYGILSGISAGVAAVGSLWLYTANEKSSDNLVGLSNILGELLFSAFLILAGGILLIIFSTLFISNPRKKILRLLNNFGKTGTLPKKYLNKIKSRLQKNSK